MPCTFLEVPQIGWHIVLPYTNFNLQSSRSARNTIITCFSTHIFPGNFDSNCNSNFRSHNLPSPGSESVPIEIRTLRASCFWFPVHHALSRKHSRTRILVMRRFQILRDNSYILFSNPYPLYDHHFPIYSSSSLTNSPTSRPSKHTETHGSAFSKLMTVAKNSSKIDQNPGRSRYFYIKILTLFQDITDSPLQFILDEPKSNFKALFEKLLHFSKAPFYSSTGFVLPLSSTEILTDAAQYPSISHFIGAEAHPRQCLSELFRAWGHLESLNNVPNDARLLFKLAIRVQSPVQENTTAACCAWALMEQRQGRLVLASKLYKYAYSITPNHIPLVQSWATFEAKFGSMKRARSLFVYLSRINNDSERPWIAWADFESQRAGNLKKARFLFRQASLAKGDPSFGENFDDCRFHALSKWSKFEQGLGNVKQARLLLQRLIDRDICGSRSMHAMAILETKEMNFAKARIWFQRSLARASKEHHQKQGSVVNVAACYQAWARMEEKLKNYSLARKFFERGSLIDPKHAYIWQAWGVMEVKLHNYNFARKIFQKGVQHNPRNAPTFHSWANMEAQLGNFEEARKLYLEAIQVDPVHAMSLYNLALLEKDQGNIENARMYFGKCVKADASEPLYWDAWGKFENSRENTKLANVLFHQARKITKTKTDIPILRDIKPVGAVKLCPPFRPFFIKVRVRVSGRPCKVWFLAKVNVIDCDDDTFTCLWDNGDSSKTLHWGREDFQFVKSDGRSYLFCRKEDTCAQGPHFQECSAFKSLLATPGKRKINAMTESPNPSLSDTTPQHLRGHDAESTTVSPILSHHRDP